MTAYPIQVYWSDEDRAWVADVPDLPFCTAHEPAPHEAVAEVEQAVAAWLEGAKAPGRPLPELRAARALIAARRPTRAATVVAGQASHACAA